MSTLEHDFVTENNPIEAKDILQIVFPLTGFLFISRHRMITEIKYYV